MLFRRVSTSDSVSTSSPVKVLDSPYHRKIAKDIVVPVKKGIPYHTV